LKLALERIMDMKGEKNKGKLFTLMSGVILGLCLAVITIIIVCIVFAAKADKRPEAEQQTTVATQSGENATEDTVETTEAVVWENEDMQQEELVVETPFCVLRYPGQWADKVRTEQADLGYGYSVAFYGAAGDREMPLFQVLFGCETETSTNVGMFVQNELETTVSVDMAENAAAGLDAEATQQMQAMQDAAEYLVAKLKKEPFFQLPQINEEEITIPNVDDAAIETTYVTLYFPGLWKDAVRWEVSSAGNGCVVKVQETFSGENLEVFSIGLNALQDSGFQMGTLKHNGKDVTVSVILSDAPQTEKWSDTDRNLYLTLQEQAFVILEKLANDAQYTSVLSVE
jgi:23S rRNA U2552 (ribose-2'-O)-methylase RlmE/FtsJ